MKIAIIAAMPEELAPMRQQVVSLNKYVCGKAIIEQTSYHNHPLLLVECGIGKVNAAIATTILIEQHKPDLIINIGSAGALKPELNIGDVVVGSEFIYADVDVSCFGYAKGQLPKMPEKFIISSSTMNLVKQLVSNNKLAFNVVLGQILSSDSFIDAPQLKQQRNIDFPDGYAVEMESTAIAHTASFYGIDVLAFRAISDKAGNNAATDFKTNLAIAAQSANSFLELLLKNLLVIVK